MYDVYLWTTALHTWDAAQGVVYNTKGVWQLRS